MRNSHLSQARAHGSHAGGQRSDSRIPGHLFTYPWTFYRTRHMKTKGSILIQRDANKWPGILESSQPGYG